MKGDEGRSEIDELREDVTGRELTIHGVAPAEGRVNQAMALSFDSGLRPGSE